MNLLIYNLDYYFRKLSFEKIITFEKLYTFIILGSCCIIWLVDNK
jgi:hypothetical protein